MEQLKLFSHKTKIPEVGPLRTMAGHLRMRITRSDCKEPESVFFRVMERMTPIIDKWLAVESMEKPGPAFENSDILYFFGQFWDSYSCMKGSE